MKMINNNFFITSPQVKANVKLFLNATHTLLKYFLGCNIFVASMASKKKIFLKQFGEHVKKIRVKKNLTQFDVACAINKDRQSIQRLESGNINPTIFYLFELSEGLEIDFNSLTNFVFVPPKVKKR